MVGELAHEAELAGWDGAFYWDGIAVGGEVYDPWVVLAVMGMRTERIRLGLMLTPPARRRPWKLARETMTIDRLTNGRLVLPVGLGATTDPGFANVGEPTDRVTRAELLDESLDVLTGLWSGTPFRYDGKHYSFEEMAFQPTPVQMPRIPIWVAAAWYRPKSMRRALRFDGVMPNPLDERGNHRRETPEDIAAIQTYVWSTERPRRRLRSWWRASHLVMTRPRRRRLSDRGPKRARHGGLSRAGRRRTSPRT